MAMQHVEMPTGRHFNLVGSATNVIVAYLYTAAPVRSAMRQNRRLVRPQLGGRADVAMAIDDHRSPCRTVAIKQLQ